MSRAGDIEQSAALWLLRLEEPDWSEEDQRRLDDWLAQADAHKAAYWRLESGWRGADRVRSLGSIAAHERSAFASRRWLPFAVAASLLLALTTFVGTVALNWWPPSEGARLATYRTQIGGHRVVSLPDGSRIELNTATVLRAQLGGTQRRVWLDRGEAYFEVAKVPGKDFVVYAGPRTVTVLGTKFAVRRNGAKVLVSVAEGRVRVDESGSNDLGRSTTITTGDTAVGEGSMTLVRADSEQGVAEELAWRSGRLVFETTTLSDAAAEFNRYNRTQLVIADPRAAEIRIGGSFEARNVDAFARLLNEAYGLKVRSNTDKIFISS